jgi:hypothetical protein
MAAQEAVEHLRADPSAEESDDESEGVPLAVRLTRLLSLLANGEYMWLQYRGSTKVSTSSYPSTCTPQIAIADAGTTGRTGAAPNPRGEPRDGGGRPVARTSCRAKNTGTGGMGQSKSGR